MSNQRVVCLRAERSGDGDGRTYSVGVADANDCFATQTFTVAPTSTVQAAFTMPATGDMGLPVQFTDGSTGATTYAWDFGDGSPIDNSAAPAHVFDLPGTYTVTLSVSNGVCESTVSNTIGIMGLSTGVAVNNHSGISIVQAGDQVVLVVDGDRDLILNVRNLLGQELIPVLRGHFAHGQHVITLPATAAGVLLVQVSDMSGGDNQVFKVVR